MNIAILGAYTGESAQLKLAIMQRLDPADPVKGSAPIRIDADPPLMRAIHTDVQHPSPLLCEAALAQHQSYDLTLLIGVHTVGMIDRQAPAASIGHDTVNARLRAVLTHRNLAYAVIYGEGVDRVEAAIRAIPLLRGARPRPLSSAARWQWSCEKCSDAACEHRIFTRQLADLTPLTTAPGTST